MKEEFTAAVGLLADMVNSDPVMELINAIVWLDPLWHEDGDEEIDDVDMQKAFHILRDCLPGIYVDALAKLHDGANEAMLENFICGEITKFGIPLDYIQEMNYGIPLHPIGINLDDIETYETHRDLIPFIESFGVDLDEGEPDISHDVRKTAIALAENLLTERADRHVDPAWEKVGHLIDWAFSCSGNTLIDNNLEALEEMGEALWWDVDNIPLAVEMYDEADIWMADSKAALEWLEAHPDMRKIFQANIEIVAAQVRNHKGKGRIDGSGISLEWPNPYASLEGGAILGAEHLQLRSDAAEA